MKNITRLLLPLIAFAMTGMTALASEADLIIPSMGLGKFPYMLGINGFVLTCIGLVFTFVTLGISFYLFGEIKKMEVHKRMSAVADIIYATCCAYLKKQIRFLGALCVIIACAFFVYVFAPGFFGIKIPEADQTFWNTNPLALWGAVLLFALVGMSGSTIVAW